MGRTNTPNLSPEEAFDLNIVTLVEAATRPCSSCEGRGEMPWGYFPRITLPDGSCAKKEGRAVGPLYGLELEKYKSLEEACAATAYGRLEMRACEHCEGAGAHVPELYGTEVAVPLLSGLVMDLHLLLNQEDPDNRDFGLRLLQKARDYIVAAGEYAAQSGQITDEMAQHVVEMRGRALMRLQEHGNLPFDPPKLRNRPGPTPTATPPPPPAGEGALSPDELAELLGVSSDELVSGTSSDTVATDDEEDPRKRS